MYKELEKKGVELRIVKHRNWAIDVNDMDRRSTRTRGSCRWRWCRTSTASCTTQGGERAGPRARRAMCSPTSSRRLARCRSTSRRSGIDFASAGTYKWLMGERGLGFLYVREDLQGTVLPTTRYGHRQVTNFNRAELTWEPLPGAAKYETGGIARAARGVRLRRHRLRAGARPRQDPRARAAAHRSPAEGAAAARLQAADAARQRDADPRVRAEGRRRHRPRRCRPARSPATVIANENRLRLSVSVFNTHDDIDRVVEVLGGRRTSSAGV